MTLPNYFLPRPPFHLTPGTITSFERLAEQIVRGDATTCIHDCLSAPTWQFLTYLCERKGVVLHGSGDPDVAEFEPRKANDVSAFGNREAVYAASDAIWAMYFAIVDRDRPLTSLVNGAFRVVGPDGTGDPYYFFSINADNLPGSPWRDGTVYVLPAETFERQPPRRYRDLRIESTQWASLVGVRPLAKIRVEPRDFPFLGQVRRHDPIALRERAQANPDAFPWVDDG